jgi:apolipoprotein N-acyltransferase
MKKNNKQKRNKDYLKAASIVVAFITLGVTLFAWWNSYDLLNTLGTVAVVIGISLLPAVFLFLLVFWIKMLIDSARQKRLGMVCGYSFGRRFLRIHLSTSKKAPPKLEVI